MLYYSLTGTPFMTNRGYPPWRLICKILPSATVSRLNVWKKSQELQCSLYDETRLKSVTAALGLKLYAICPPRHLRNVTHARRGIKRTTITILHLTTIQVVLQMSTALDLYFHFSHIISRPIRHPPGFQGVPI